MTYLETGIYRLSTLSPIHIRAGELRYGEGTIRVGGTVYVVDTPKLQSEILHFGGIEGVNKYTETFSNSNSGTTLVDFLKRIKYPVNKSNIEKIAKGIIHLPSGNCFMQSGLGKHFIPGSSIKGAIKTAVLYDSITQQIASGKLDFDDFVKKQIVAYNGKHGNREKKKFKEVFAAELLKDAFQSTHPQESPWNDSGFTPNQFGKIITTPGSGGATVETLDGTQIHLPLDNIQGSLIRNDWIEIDTLEEKSGQQVVVTYKKIDENKVPKVSIRQNIGKQNPDRNEEPPGPFTDIFRAIKVKDAMIEETSEVQTEKILFTSLNKSNQIARKKMGGNTDYECFHGETDISISIDHNILESFKRAGATLPFSDLTSLIDICRDFAEAQWNAEQQFLAAYAGGSSLNLGEIKKFYTDPKNMSRATLRVGWGTGMLGTTLSLLLDEPTRVELRNTVISGGNHVRPEPAPKSRRFISEKQQPIYPLGWIELAQ